MNCPPLSIKALAITSTIWPYHLLGYRNVLPVGVDDLISLLMIAKGDDAETRLLACSPSNWSAGMPHSFWAYGA